jgi:hypothetical protein
MSVRFSLKSSELYKPRCSLKSSGVGRRDARLSVRVKGDEAP